MSHIPKTPQSSESWISQCIPRVSQRPTPTTCAADRRASFLLSLVSTRARAMNQPKWGPKSQRSSLSPSSRGAEDKNGGADRLCFLQTRSGRPSLLPYQLLGASTSILGLWLYLSSLSLVFCKASSFCVFVSPCKDTCRGFKFQPDNQDGFICETVNVITFAESFLNKAILTGFRDWDMAAGGGCIDHPVGRLWLALQWRLAVPEFSPVESKEYGFCPCWLAMTGPHLWPFTW